MELLDRQAMGFMDIIFKPQVKALPILATINFNEFIGVDLLVE